MNDFLFDNIRRLKQIFKGHISDQSLDNKIKEVIFEVLNSPLEEIVNELLPFAAKRIGIETAKLGKRISQKGVVYSEVVNGATKSSDNWKTFTIEINLGLIQFLYHMCMLFSTRVGVMGIKDQPSQGTNIPWGKTVDEVKDFVKAYFENKLMSHKGFSLLQLNNNQVIISAKMLLNLKRFAVGHELGHIITKITTRRLEEMDYSMYLAKEILKSNLSAMDSLKPEQEWGEELAADNISLALVLNLFNNDYDRILAYSSAELLFICMNMLERYYHNVSQESPVITTHPPSLVRLEVLRMAAKDNLPSTFEIGKSFETFAELFLKEL